MFGGIYFGGAVIGGFMSLILAADAAYTIPAGPPTQWGNNDVKPLQLWAKTNKQLSQWANNDVKVPSIFTAVGKGLTQWGPEQPVQTYFYNDPFISYGSPLTEYDFIKDLNPSNQLLVTRWTGVA